MKKSFFWIIDKKGSSQDLSFKISLTKSMSADNLIFINPEKGEAFLNDGSELSFTDFSKLEEDFSPSGIYINSFDWGTEVFGFVKSIKTSPEGMGVFVISDCLVKTTQIITSVWKERLPLIDFLIINKDFLEVFTNSNINNMMDIENATELLIGDGGHLQNEEFDKSDKRGRDKRGRRLSDKRGRRLSQKKAGHLAKGTEVVSKGWSFSKGDGGASDLDALTVFVKDGVLENTVQSSFYRDRTRKNWLNINAGKFDRENAKTVFTTAMCILKSQNFDTLDSLVIATAYEQQYTENTALDSWPEKQDYLPWLFPDSSLNQRVYSFSDCGQDKLGFYPVVHSFEWVERLLKLNVKTIQLRVKDKTGSDLENEIKNTVSASEKYNCRLFINDYWELAIKYGAYGVHLGQEDLAEADLDKIEKAGLRLGISTHCYREVARALAINPSYIAIGPVFETKLKKMDFLPQGVEALARWVRSLNYPLVAIGGITLELGKEILSTGAEGVAVVRDVTLNENPEKRVKEWLSLIDKN